MSDLGFRVDLRPVRHSCTVYKSPEVRNPSLKPVVKFELDQTAAVEGAGDLAEVGRRDSLVAHVPGGMIEHVGRSQAQLDRLTFGDLGDLGYLRIRSEERRVGKDGSAGCW